MNLLSLWLLALSSTTTTPAPTSTVAAAPNWNSSLTVAVQASYLPTPFEYSYIDVLYQNIDRGDGVPEQDGLAFRGSFDVTDNIRLLMSYGEASSTTNGVKDKLNDYSIGFGMHGSYNRWLDVIGNFEWVRRELSGTIDGRHKGWVAGVGVRLLPFRSLEVDATALFQNSASNDGGGQLGAVWNISRYVGVRGAGMVLGDETRYWGGLRFSL
jgi:hypothetical protein